MSNKQHHNNNYQLHNRHNDPYSSSGDQVTSPLRSTTSRLDTDHNNDESVASAAATATSLPSAAIAAGTAAVRQFWGLGGSSNNSNEEISKKNRAAATSSSTSSSILFGVEEENGFQQQQLQLDQGEEKHNDQLNYALLIVLYTLQGIPMGLSASIPFLIQQKLKLMTGALGTNSGAAAAAAAALSGDGGAAAAAALSEAAAAASSAAARLSYNANAIFALCSWPFSLKLFWAPIVDACFLRRFGRRKSWLVPVQALAGALMVFGSTFVEQQLGMDGLLKQQHQHQRHLQESGNNAAAGEAGFLLLKEAEASFNVKGITAFFFVLYFLMATQDIAVDGWALTMLSKQNRGRGPVCNSIGQNIGYFLSFVGFLALNDAESSELLWRPLLGLPSNPTEGLVSLGTFIRFMGYFMLATTTAVALFKREVPLLVKDKVESPPNTNNIFQPFKRKKDDDDDDHELDAYEIGLKETYHRLWAACNLPAVKGLFLVLLTYRLPTALGDNVKFLKAVEFGLSKSTTALLSPTIILPLAILVPILATKVWGGHPLRQFMTAYRFRVTLAPLLDCIMLYVLKQGGGWSHTVLGKLFFWSILVFSTAGQAICNSLQMNSQMTFFAQRVDPAIGGSYMTLLNTAANLGGTWPSSFVMWLVGFLTRDPDCHTVVVDDLAAAAAAAASPDTAGAAAGGRRHPPHHLHHHQVCTGGRDPYFVLQFILSILGCLWIFLMGKRVNHIASLPDDAWRTHLFDEEEEEGGAAAEEDQETGRFFRGGGGRTRNSSENGKLKKREEPSSSNLLKSVDVELGGFQETARRLFSSNNNNNDSNKQR